MGEIKVSKSVNKLYFGQKLGKVYFVYFFIKLIFFWVPSKSGKIEKSDFPFKHLKINAFSQNLIILNANKLKCTIFLRSEEVWNAGAYKYCHSFFTVDSTQTDKYFCSHKHFQNEKLKERSKKNEKLFLFDFTTQLLLGYWKRKIKK